MFLKFKFMRMKKPITQYNLWTLTLLKNFPCEIKHKEWFIKYGSINHFIFAIFGDFDELDLEYRIDCDKIVAHLSNLSIY